jgi:hypothetical protein
MGDEEEPGLNRRDFIRKAAATTAAAWAVPVISTVAATPAFARTQGSPSPGGCFKWVDPASGKMNGCTQTCQATGCSKGGCHEICAGACNLPEEACPDEYCDPGCWSCDEWGNSIFVC